MSVSHFMSWIGGVDLFSSTPGAGQPNVIVHVARTVTTPVGSAPSGLIFFQPEPDQPPLFAGFVSAEPAVGAYFGPHIFAGTPFENMPLLTAQIEITETPSIVSAKVVIPGYTIEVGLSALEPLQKVDRPAGAPFPFTQQGVESHAAAESLRINGETIALSPLPYSAEMGGSSVWAPGGTYTR